MTKNQNLDEKSKFYQKSGKSHLIIFPRVIIFRKFRIDFPRTNLDPTQIRDDGDLIWVIRLKLSPTIDNIHDFPQGVEYISKILFFQIYFLFLRFLFSTVKCEQGTSFPYRSDYYNRSNSRKSKFKRRANSHGARPAHSALFGRYWIFDKFGK